jgi:HAD superfamily hydrolase (TIGR01549 family)
MVRIVSFDMDGTLIESEYTDWVWHHGIPGLYAEKAGLAFDEAKDFVIREYRKVGEAGIEWYDIKYWFRLFELEMDWRSLMERYTDKIRVYPDVHPLLSRLKGSFRLVLTSNAGREFIDVEMEATGLAGYFDQIFSATSDFREVKKTPRFYQRICEMLKVQPEEMAHVGDHYEFDYLVPRDLGIQAFYLDRSARREGNSVLWDLRDMENRLSVKRDMRKDRLADGRRPGKD